MSSCLWKTSGKPKQSPGDNSLTRARGLKESLGTENTKQKKPSVKGNKKVVATRQQFRNVGVKPVGQTLIDKFVTRIVKTQPIPIIVVTDP